MVRLLLFLGRDNGSDYLYFMLDYVNFEFSVFPSVPGLCDLPSFFLVISCQKVLVVSFWTSATLLRVNSDWVGIGPKEDG